MREITTEQSGAFIERFTVAPTGSGELDGLRFAVKDLVDVAGYRTGRGNPTWLASAVPASVSAVCVEQLLAAGATCVGKTITDELAYSLLGENHHYGTPLNPAAPDRVPGGSSSGSASAVACGLVDFAVGTDTGGSVRVPASNCGIWGWRPTFGTVSVAGVMPLAPSFDTVGILAREVETMRAAGRVLVGEAGRGLRVESRGPEKIRVCVLSEPFSWADDSVRQAVEGAVAVVELALGATAEPVSLVELCDDDGAAEQKTWLDIYRKLVSAEAMCSHGTWIAAEQPELGPMTESGFKAGAALDRSRIGEVIGRREAYCRAMRRTIRSRDVLVMPSAPSVAPLKGTDSDRNSDYYRRALAFGAVGGAGKLPQISTPLATADGAPIGVSILGSFGEDALLLDVACAVGEQFANVRGAR
jgi:amidase